MLQLDIDFLSYYSEKIVVVVLAVCNECEEVRKDGSALHMQLSGIFRPQMLIPRDSFLERRICAFSASGRCVQVRNGRGEDNGRAIPEDKTMGVIKGMSTGRCNSSKQTKPTN